MFDHQRTETEKWMIAAFDSATFLNEMDAEDRVGPALGEFWPFWLPYYSPLNPCFSPLYSKFFLSKGADAREILLRDGAIPLLWFLSQHAPESVAGPLYVHESLAPLVPQTWRGRIRYYRHKSLSQVAPESLILVCPLTERFVSTAQVERSLDAIEAALGKRKMSTIKVRLFCRFPGRDHEVKLEWLKSIFSRFANVSTFEWRDVEGTSSLKGTAYAELNGGWLHCDSYVQQRVLSRGASLLLQPQSARTAKDKFIPFSPYHGVELVKPKAARPADETFARKLQDFYMEMAGEEDGGGLWPKWFERSGRAVWQDRFGYKS